MKTIYESKVKIVGESVGDFQEEDIFVTFGEKAPDTLKDHCYIIELAKVDGDIAVGQKVSINEKEYAITAIGNKAQQHLADLGHVTFAFTGETVAELPGTIYIEKSEVPKLEEGSVIKILA